MSDNLTVFGTDYTGVTGIKAKGKGNGTLTYIRPTGTKSISANGTGIDVAQYASVDVVVEDSTLVVTLSYNDQTEMWEPDCTYAEAYAAYQAEKTIVFESVAESDPPAVFGEYVPFAGGGFAYFVYELHYSANNELDGFIQNTYFLNSSGIQHAGADTAWLTTDATATPSDVLSGKVFYNADGQQTGTATTPTPTLQSKSVSYTPSETAQSATVTADSGYDGLSSVDVSVGAISSTYVGTGVERHSSADAVIDEESVAFPAGYYAEQHYGDVAIGTVSNQSLSVESVGHGEYAVRATVNVTEGYVPSSTKTDSLHLTDYLQAKTVTPTESQQSVSADDGKIGLYGVTVEAIPSDYAGSGITRRSSTDLTASGATVTVPAGYYSAQASKAVASGTAGTPTATKGTVSNHSVSVTPSVTNTAGYIAGGTENGTAVTVSASELVSGSQTITDNGTVNVTNLASVTVDIDFVTYHTSSSEPTSSQGSDGDIWLVTE